MDNGVAKATYVDRTVDIRRFGSARNRVPTLAPGFAAKNKVSALKFESGLLFPSGLPDPLKGVPPISVTVQAWAAETAVAMATIEMRGKCFKRIFCFVLRFATVR